MGTVQKVINCLILLFMIFFTVFFISGDRSSEFSSSAFLEANIVNITQKPELYENKRVYVTGYLIEFPLMLYLNKEQSDFSLGGISVSIQDSTKNGDLVSSVNCFNKYVGITAVLKKPEKYNTKNYYLTDVSRVESINDGLVESCYTIKE
ncbi:hypothetical protein ACFODZ_12065 [Marinicella sediminis]|uniref:Uncharacterized protein n=1 Tax=Marinicella sediminis TaxID=1792834 RepID=A0ABV7JCY3_9GAMM|nr:hypothetical protein [Marinicella sediminis]